MSNNKEKNDENFLDSKETESQTKIPEEVSSSEQKLSPDGNSNENDVMIGSDENVNETQTNKETASVKSGEITQPTPNNLSETTSPKASCSYQDFDSSSSRSPRSSDRHIYVASNRKSVVCRLRLEIENLQAEVVRLRGLVVSSASSTYNEATTDDKEEPQTKIANLQKELQLTKEAVTILRNDRRRLKAEKYDLLLQIRQLYATLQEKEKEIRDFIRNYEQKEKQNESSIQQLSAEREERERERWSLLRHARDEAERSLSLAAQLNAKELQLKQAQEELEDIKRQLAGTCLSDQESLASLPRRSKPGRYFASTSNTLAPHQADMDRGSCSADSGVRINSDRESGITSLGGNLSDSTDGTSIVVTADRTKLPLNMYQSISSLKECNATPSPMSTKSFIGSADASILSRSVEQLNSPLDQNEICSIRRSKHTSSSISRNSSRSGTWGSISRVFARSKNRSKSSILQGDIQYDTYRNWSPLTEEGYAEKLRLLREASSIPMERWKASTVLAWLEVGLGMPQYGARCAENIKSGKVLLELSDAELECGLGISHPMHRKKIRLAIEEHRHPSLVRYPCIGQLGHTWVSSEWLPDLGLAQYSENFAQNMIDARMLEHINKKELEKSLGVTRKFHQASVFHGINLLRIMKYDRQALAIRRHQCENIDADPLVWTNSRFIRWIRSIDLHEYADNLKDSGIHGGLVVLEPSFTGDTMATALGIPANKNIIRRHLTSELESLILPARYVILCQTDEYQTESNNVLKYGK